jgi:phosphoglycolate phosphatase
LLISRQSGINPERLIYVGDSDVDMETARNAGMYAVGALWGFRTKEELISNGAEYLLKDPMDLLQILQEEDGA